MTYYLARDYAEYIGIVKVYENGINTKLYPIDDEGNIIKGISPRYIKHGFVLRKQFEKVNPVPIEQTWNGQTAMVYFASKVEETEDKFIVECEDKLAKALRDSKVVEKMSDELAKSELKRLMFERGSKAVILWMIRQIMDKLRQTELDKIVRMEEFWEVEKEIEKLKKETLQILEGRPEETLQKIATKEKGVDVNAEEE